MKLEQGKPIMEGRYVAYVQGVLEWLSPVLVTWNRGAWYYHHSSQKYPDPVVHWIGPLPALKMAEKPRLEFDL